MAKTWRQKLENGREPVVEILDKPFAGMKAGARMLISTPLEVESELRKIPKGAKKSVPEFRDHLASKHKAEGTCPLTTSIFLRIVAEVALQEMAAGKAPSEVAPFWRVLDAKNPVSKKLSCGPQAVETFRMADV